MAASDDHSHDASSTTNVPPANPLPQAEDSKGIRPTNVPPPPPVPPLEDAKVIKKDLIAFQSMMGLIPMTPEPGDPRRYFANKGIYTEILHAEIRRKRQYYICTMMLNACILLQIIFAATLTALGASSSPHDVITVFGAINTAVAGLLALLKGQGLPDRLRRDWHGLREVRDLIDERERAIGQGWVYAGVKEEVDAVMAKYQQVLVLMEQNRPETYVVQSQLKGTTTDPTQTNNSTGTGPAANPIPVPKVLTDGAAKIGG